MTSQFAKSVRSSSADLSLRELLEQPITELIGVSQDAKSALNSVDVHTIFDLGSSNLFAQAAAVLAASSSDVGLAAADLLTPAGSSTAVAQAPQLPLSSLRALSLARANALSAALAVTSIRELALWPPRLVAHTIVSVATGTTIDSIEETAEELRPRLGEYPTERVYYDKLVMLGSQANPNAVPFTSPLSLEQLVSGSLAFGNPAVGALATYSQSWFAQAITLGHMVHSLALAPGEATRIAVIDWTRRTSATTSESLDERESLDNSTSHARAISEVQNAVADEMQSGGSIATGWAKSTSSGSGFAGSIGGGIAGTIGEAAGVLGFGFGGSSASQDSETNSEATSTSWSVGSRSVMAEMNQRVNDRTEQHSTSVRNRRASAVREVSQSEHEQVSTRVVANYNHMHALTVQYYEVVQIYRVAVKLSEFVRAIFLPFDVLDFTGANATDVVARFRSQLLGAALTRRAAELLRDDRGRIEVRSGVRVSRPITAGALAEMLPLSAVARRDMTAVTSSPPADSGVAASPANPQPAVTRLWSTVRPGPVAEVLPGDAELASIAFEDVTVDRVRVDQAGVAADASTFVVSATTRQVDFPNRIPMRTIESMHVARDSGAAGDGSMVLRYESDGHQSIAVVPLSLLEGTGMQKVGFFAGDTADRRAELLDHLQANRSYYTRAVLERLDSASLVLLLSGTTWLGKPLIEQVEPHPIAVTGNFLVLRAPAGESDPSGVDGFPTWGELLKDREIDIGKDVENARLIPIPTGGVFAEAVLGRSNSAEKLDITRFWNWQDSPIPLQPPEIAPVGTGSRATSEDLRPGQFGAPVVTVQGPTNLPDPAGLSAALGALATAGMFRDMSGLAGTQAAAQAASAGTLSAATEAGRIASANYQAATTQATEMGKAAADMWKVMKSKEGSGGSGKPATAGISGDGAHINHGRDMDERGLTGGGDNAGAGGSGGPLSGATGSSTAPDVMPGVPPFLREVAYGDESVAASSDLAGAFARKLGIPVENAVAEVGVPGSGGGTQATSVDPFPVAPTVAFVTNDTAMTTAFAAAVTGNTTGLCAALVDLTGNPAVPAYVGMNDDETLFAGSLLKICPMYAAFALRHQVRLFVKAALANGSTVTLPGIATDIEAAWKPKLAALFAGRPSTAFGSSQDITFPQLAQIFTFAADGTVDFASGGLTQQQINAVGEFGAPKGKFLDWMRSMLHWSNNAAAGRCIMALGYVYLNGLLADGDFFDPGSGSGMWVSADYRSHDWVKTAVERNANAGGQALTTRWATAQGRQKSNLTATAASTARLMTMLAQGTLVDDDSSKEMRGLMTAAHGGIGSYVRKALVADARPATLVVSKIGYGDDKFSHDCAIVERTVAGKQLRYVAVGLGSKPSENRKDLNRLFARMDQAIIDRSG